MTFKDLRNVMLPAAKYSPYRGTLMGAVLRYRLVLATTADPVTEAEYHNVPFTPIWWWWNAEADEYVMTLWDTEAGKDPDRPKQMLVPSNTISQARKLINVRSKV